MQDIYEKEFNKEHELKILRAHLKAVDDLTSGKKDYYKLKYNKRSGMFDVVERRNPMTPIYIVVAVGYVSAVILSAMFFPTAFRTFFGF